MQNFQNVETISKFNPLLQVGLATSEEIARSPAKPVTLTEAQKGKFSKREYNKAYYQQRKLKKGGETNSTSAPPREFFNFPILKLLEIAILSVLVIFMTIVLIKEAASFYLAEQDKALYAYLKAGVIETIAIIFSFARSNHQFLKWLQRVMMIMFCGFTLYLMSGSAIKTASKDTTQVEMLNQTLKQLETELIQKEQLRNEYLKRARLTMTRRYEKIVDQTREKLDATRKSLCSAQAPAVITQNLRIVILFRVLLVITNLVCIHRIVELAASKAEKGGGKRKKHG